MKGVVFTLDAIFALAIAVASISILLYFNYSNQTPLTVQYSNAQSALSSLLSTSVDAMQNSSALAKAISNQFVGANETWPQFGGGIFRNSSNDFGPIKPIISSVFSAGSAITTGVVADYGNIYFATGSTLYAVNATTNNVLWSSTTASGVASTPALYAGTLVFANSANLVALNARTGALLWSISLPSTVTSPILAYDNRVIFGATNGGVYSFFAGNGTTAWTVSGAGTSPFNIIVADGNLAARASGNVLLLMQTGNAASTLWSVTPPSITTGLAGEGSEIYFGGSTMANALVVNGLTVTGFPVTTASATGVADYKNYVIYQVATGVAAFSPSGVQLWTATVPSSFGTAIAGAIPAISGKMVYTLWSNGLAGQYVNNGTVAWFTPIPSSAGVLPYMALAYGRLYVVVGSSVIAYGACNAPMHSSALSTIATLYLNSDPGCAEALSSAAFPAANYTVVAGNASARNTIVGNFNGASSYVQLPASAEPTGAFAISLWLNPSSWSSSTYPAVFGGEGLGSAGTQGGVAFTAYPAGTPPNIEFDIYNSANRASTSSQIPLSTFPINTWTFVVAQWNGTSSANAISVYVNGVQVAKQAGLTGPLAWGSYNFYIGDSARASSYFSGSLADFQMYGNTLTSGQIQTLYQRGISGLPLGNAGLVGWWPLGGDASDYAGFNTGYGNGVAFISQNYTALSLANAYSISSASVFVPLLNYTTGAENVIKVGVYTWK
jgi:Concanavalin A-like lectin/glucanases superfamily/PQQ-like domain